MKKYYILMIMLLLVFVTGCSWSEINPRPQDYMF